MEERFRIAGELARDEYEVQIDEVVRGVREPVDFEEVDEILDKAQEEADTEVAYREAKRKGAVW